MRNVVVTIRIAKNTLLGNLRDLIAVAALASSTAVATAQIVVPDASNSTKNGCPISLSKFNGWFVSGSVTVNGMVKPPDNVSFSDQGNCSFYQSAEQMFLWVTSPPLPGYGGGSYVFDSPVFYEVSPSAGAQPPALVAKSVERSKIATVSVPKRGPDGSVVVFDDAGRMYGVVDAGGHPFIESRDRIITEIDSITKGPDGMPVFLDKSGKAHTFPPDQLPTLHDTEGNIIIFKMPPISINAHGQLFFLDESGKAISVGSGQADRNVLITKDNRLVYYMMQVNDVYAYFLTGVKHGMITPIPIMFPTRKPELKAVEDYAKKSFLDESALVVELKSSWIELPPGGDYAGYVSIPAQVPDFDMSSDTKWKQIGWRPATLAMVGMHIAFSVKGHPELIWATFEHVNNAPNAPYQYWDSGDVPRVGPGTVSSGGGVNQPRMVMDGNDIMAINGKIGPIDVLRVSPWGVYGAEYRPNRNTEVISTNNNVQGRLMRGDVRKNYVFVGAIWGATSGQGSSTLLNSTQGSDNLANSTMETFIQPAGCFECHSFNTHKLGSADAKGNGNGLSHIYGVLNGFFPDP